MPGRLILLLALLTGPRALVAVTPEDCKVCHEDMAKRTAVKAHQACTGCHFGGEKHAESADPKDIRKPESNACGTCHKPQKAGHAHGSVECGSCHAVHQSDAALPRGVQTAGAKKSPVNDRCATCHLDVMSQFLKPHRHKVSEGVATCLDCHNPHQQRTQTALTAKCYGCHGDKRGPFAFEHAPVKTDGCQACHEPHGSVNPRMLTRQNVQLQCLECHAGLGVNRDVPGGIPPAFHDLRTARYRSCTACHSKVHGSHTNRTLLR